MFLSQIHLQPQNPSVRQCLYDAQDMHRSIMALFADDSLDKARKELGVLYRVYKTPDKTLLYLLSKTPPDKGRLAKGFEMPAPPKSLSAIISNFNQGQVYCFDLLASPVKKVASVGKNSKRVFLTDSHQRMDWLNRKADTAGFRVNWMREEGQETIRAALKPHEPTITCMGVRFVGMLTVTDAAKFGKAYTEGIGVQKAYGFGLLLLAPSEYGT